jgi:hypothetical protein
MSWGAGFTRKSAALRNFKGRIFKTEILQTMKQMLRLVAAAWVKKVRLPAIQE